MTHQWTRPCAAAATVAALIAGLTIGAGAFGDNGHRVVGRIAEMHLAGSRALAEARKILRPGETLADAAVWPDVIKNPLYEDGDTALFRLNHPAHDTYHFANLPFQATRYQASALGARPTDIVGTARESIRVLRGQSTMFTRREALRMLAHLAGDLHQPLHTGTGFVSASGALRFITPQGGEGWRPTLGGNALVYGPQDRFNLHSYWDAHAVNLAMGRDDAAAFAARVHRDVPIRKEWRSSGDPAEWPAAWATESLRFAREVHDGITIAAYLGPDEAKRTAHRWRIGQPQDYDDLARRMIPIQLSAAGFRLAATLQAIWPE